MIPIPLVLYEIALSISKWYLRGAIVTGHSGGFTVKQGTTKDSHGQIFNGKQKPRIFMSGVVVQSLSFCDYDVASLNCTPADEFSWKPV